MDIWEHDKLALFIAFVIPGFISIKCYQLVFPGSERGTGDQLIDAVAYSSINYAILFLPIARIAQSNLKNSCPSIYYFFVTFVLFIAPIIWVLIWKYLRTRQFFQRNAPHPTARPWDYVFDQRKMYWVKIVLKSEGAIGGLYGTKSFSSSAPAEESIYLEEKWLLGDDGEFLRKANDTAGVMILSITHK